MRLFDSSSEVMSSSPVNGDAAHSSAIFVRSSNGVGKGSSKSDDDDDTEVAGVPPVSALLWEDADLRCQTLNALNHMRRNRHFCDVTLQIGKQDFFAHRAVLAAASPYLMELFTSADDLPTRKEVEEVSGGILYQLNGGFEKDAIEIIIDYAYTGRLHIPPELVLPVCAAAVRLKMYRVASECARFLSSNINLDNCLELRSMAAIMSRMPDLADRVDAFVSEHIDVIRESRAFFALPRIDVEVLNPTRDELEVSASVPQKLSRRVLDWLHVQWLDDDRLTIEDLRRKKHMLYLSPTDNTFKDCQSIGEGSPGDSEIVQDYRKVSREMSKEGGKQKVRRHTTNKRPRELLFLRSINGEEAKTEDKVEDWKLVSCTALNDKTVLALLTVDGHLTACSIIQRVNTAEAVPMTPLNGASVPPTPTAAQAGIFEGLESSSSTVRFKTISPTNSVKSFNYSRPPSVEKLASEFQVPLARMDQAKCAVGAACLDNKLVVCGGYDRGECLDTVSVYDPATNEWCSADKMLTKRGRFDATVVGNVLFAVAGSNGASELTSAEKYDGETGRWASIASLPVPVSSIGLCNLNGSVYCIGGTYGQSGNKHCFILNSDHSKWERIASLNTGRSQSAVTSFRGKIWVVGGCDAWNPLCSVEIYDPETNSWRLGPPMGTPRRGCGLVEKDGLLYVIGGSDGTQSLSTTEIYDPRMNLWTVGPNLTACRANVSATVVGDKIWAVGGFSGKVFLNTIEYMDNVHEEWMTMLPNLRDESSGAPEKEEEATDDKTVVDAQEKEVPRGVTEEESPPAESSCGN